MPYAKKPLDVNQFLFMSFDSFVDPESIARTIGSFVDNLSLSDFGFAKPEPSSEGRPRYDPGSMLKLLLYGYKKDIRSVRKLSDACVTNLEVIWLMGGLTPDFRTIASFRTENIESIRKVFRKFVRTMLSTDKEVLVFENNEFRTIRSTEDENLEKKIRWYESRALSYLDCIGGRKQKKKTLSHHKKKT